MCIMLLNIALFNLAYVSGYLVLILLQGIIVFFAEFQSCVNY